VFEALMYLTEKYGKVFPSLEGLAHLARCCRQSVVTALDDLELLGFVTRIRRVRRVGTPLGFKVDVGVSNVRKCYRAQLLVTKWSTVQSKASKGSNFAMDDTSKKSEPAVRRVVWGRQFLASTVVVPPDVAEHLNTDAMAVLAVIRNEAQASGKCSLPLARIAERANIGRAKARAAIRLAEGLGLIAIEETPDRKRVIVNRGVTSRC
jgi:DNA-binding MarR family transcriptional regulator